MLSYEAPDIANAPHVQQMGGRYFSSTASSRSSVPSASGDDTSIHSRETDATSLDLSSPELSQDPYHKDAYFKATAPSPLSTRSTTSDRQALSPNPSLEVTSPRIPTRAASHSKKAHVLSHKASVRRAATTVNRPSVRDRIERFDAQGEQSQESHPFGRELEQLNEAAEEFGQTVRSISFSAEAEIDRNVMQAKGLLKFCANDYMHEISTLYTVFEEDKAARQPMVWI